MTDTPETKSGVVPFLVVAGGAILGGLAAALTQHSLRERQILGPLGTQVRRRTTAAARDARVATLEQLDKLGVNREAATALLREAAIRAVETAAVAGVAALKAAREKGDRRE